MISFAKSRENCAFISFFVIPGPERDVHIPLSYLGGIPHYLSFNIYYTRIRPQPVRRRHDTGLHPVYI